MSPHAAEQATYGSRPLDEGRRLPYRFEVVDGNAQALLARLNRGEITLEQAAAEAAGLVVTDQHGTEWTIGLTTGRWYARNADGQYEPADPPRHDPVADQAYGTPDDA